MIRRIYTDERSKKQGSVFAKYSITNKEANRRGLARWAEYQGTGAWEHLNFQDNFGENDESKKA